MNIKKLPIGMSTLEEIINSGFLYVDKTELVHKLITENRRCFFSRPRRFGKSLLISTLKEIFLGNKELFKDLWIGQDDRYTWEKRPVVHIDFSTMNAVNAIDFERSLSWTVTMLAKAHDIDVSEAPSADDKIYALITQLAQRAKVAVLIDEYDAPLLKHITDIEAATAIRNMLSSFHATIKGLDEHIHFTFVTGVTKFSKTSLFSGPNNLNDISLSEKYATLCGYTEQEIIDNFSDYIDDCARTQQTTSAMIINQMRSWYNGYQMSDYLVDTVYNPFSVLLYFDNKKIKNYWFASGTPTFLVKLIQKNLFDFKQITNREVSDRLLDSFEIDSIQLVTLLYQTGYLTIKSYDPASRLYTLAYPNEEVRESLNDYLINAVLGLGNSSASVVAAHELRTALVNQDLNLFCSALQSLFAHIPYQLHLQKEAFYHALLQMICNVLGINVAAEVSIATGRIDMTLNTPTALYIFEFKLNQSAEVALQQIKDRRYYEKYRATHATIYLVGLAFSYKTKTITHAASRV